MKPEPPTLRLESVNNSPVVEYRCLMGDNPNEVLAILRRELLADGREYCDGGKCWKPLMDADLIELLRVDTPVSQWIRGLGYSQPEMPDRTMTPLSAIGRRHQISRAEMAAVLRHLESEGLDLHNDCVIPNPGEDLAAGWARMCQHITVVSVAATLRETLGLAGRWHGMVRYDEPGSMHPLFYAELMFAPAALENYEHDQIGQLRRKVSPGGRLLVVTD